MPISDSRPLGSRERSVTHCAVPARTRAGGERQVGGSRTPAPEPSKRHGLRTVGHPTRPAAADDARDRSLSLERSRQLDLLANEVVVHGSPGEYP